LYFFYHSMIHSFCCCCCLLFWWIWLLILLKWNDINRELPPHPNVVRMYGISIDGPEPIIVFEYCEGGSTSFLISDHNYNYNHNHNHTHTHIYI
jgi:serine/threonine protein kinase